MRTNYHTHTPLCKHASGDMAQYAAIAAGGGYAEMGFADHCPWNFADGYVSHMRMVPAQMPGYVAEARRLAAEYEGRMRVLCGLECEYYPDMLDWMRDVKAEYGLDYLIFGNHYDTDERRNVYFGKCQSPDVLRRFGDTTVKGMLTGMFAYVAHPDLCFRRYAEFDAEAQAVSRDICRCARELGLPLEYNVHGYVKRAQGKITGLGYPCRRFWETAAQEGVRGIIGVDAHEVSELGDTEAYDSAVQEMDELGIERVVRLCI